jgi:hypothetical protein
MGLKFRRGSTAQQSGSLAFGEPYVNTTLGTLVVGGATGDIILSSTGTGSTGNFGAISGSGLDITGNANVAGNLTLGGKLTIGDNTSDTVNVIASLSSSLIPSLDSIFDLGSPSKQWRDLYLSSASLYIDGTQVLSSNATELIFTTDTGQSIKFNELGTDNIILQTVDGDIELKSSGGGDLLLDPTAGLISVKGNVSMQDGTAKFLSSGGTNIVFGNDLIITGSITTTGAINGLTLSTGIVSSSAQTIANLPTGTVSGSSQITYASISSIPAGIVSGSSQIDITSTTGFSTYSTSVDSRITTEKGRVDAILSAAAADKDSFAEIVTLINSVDLTNDTAFASFYTASVGRLNNLESTSGSVNISVSNLNTYTGSNDTTNGTQNTRLTALEASASTALSTNGTQATSITNLNSATASLMIETANLETFSSSALTRLDNLEGKDFSITLTGDVTGTGTVTNLSNVSFATTVAANSVALGTDTTGDYVASLVAGTNITLSNNSGEGATPTIGLTNSSTTIGTTAIALGASSTTLAGLTSVSSTGFTGALTGNASTATTLATARNINGVSFNGSADITVTAAAGTLSGATLSSGVTASSLTSVGTLTSLTVSGATATGALTVTGAITATGDITAFYTSDKRHKNNIKTIPNALEKVTKLNGVTWEWNDDVNEVTKSTPKTGLIAQEVQEVLPEVVKTRDDGFLALDYSKMMGLLVEAIKEQQSQIEELKAQIGSK